MLCGVPSSGKSRCTALGRKYRKERHDFRYLLRGKLWKAPLESSVFVTAWRARPQVRVLVVTSSFFVQSAHTPSQARWDETPGRAKGSETPGATPGYSSTRMWDPTPAHATPGHATPGHETPGGTQKGAAPGTPSARRNRWDETPKTERGGWVPPTREREGHRNLSVSCGGALWVESWAES